MTRRTSILSTAILGDAAVAGAASQGVDVSCVPFIRTERRVDEELAAEIREMCALPVTVVFTSSNAVAAIGDILAGQKPSWEVYCIGNATLNAVEKLLGESVVGVADNAGELAGLIINDNVSEVVFFCGDKRLDTLPSLLAEHDILVYEEVVYTTLETSQLVTDSYDGILFFSPSAVESFFSRNVVQKEVVLFAIGTTTATAIQKFTNARVIVGSSLSKEQLLMEAVEYFNTHAVA